MKLRRLRNILTLALSLTFPFSSKAAEIFLPALDFPAPSGLYSVGTTYLHFIDKNRPETLTQNKNDFRELEVQAWYPVKPGDQKALAQYWKYPELVGPALVKDMFAEFPDALGTLTDSSLAAVGASKTHSYLDALVTDTGERFPVLIFSHGYDGLISQNTVQMEELASHGYVVFSISHTYEEVITVFPDGRTARYLDAKASLAADEDKEENKILRPLFQKLAASQSAEEKMSLIKDICKNNSYFNKILSRWTADIKFFVDQLSLLDANHGLFKGRLDLDKVGVLGHSFGGCASIQALFEDKRIKACINLDGQGYVTWQFENGVTGPFMEMIKETNQVVPVPIVYNMARSAAYRIIIKGSKHYNYSDLSLFPALFKSIGFLGEIDGRRCIKIYNDYSLAFFDKHLKNRVTPILDGPSVQYPEVIFERRNTQH